ncbi:MAG: DUF4114 domain-containing protein [Gemmataceae bacterium]
MTKSFKANPTKKPTRHLDLETLETRVVPALNTSLNAATGFLYIDGSNESEVVRVEYTSEAKEQIKITMKTDFGWQGDWIHDAANVQSMFFNGRRGEDYFENQTDIPWTSETKGGTIHTSLEAAGDSGVFTVGADGQVKIDYLFRGTANSGQLAIFNLDGLDQYQVGSPEYIEEAARRALTNSDLGSIVVTAYDETAAAVAEAEAAQEEQTAQAATIEAPNADRIQQVASGDYSQSYQEGMGAVALVTDAEQVVGQESVSSLVFYIDGLADGNYELLTIGGVDIPLGTDVMTPVSIEVFGTTLLATYNSSVGSLTLSPKSGGQISSETLQSLMTTMSYRNEAEQPTSGTRTVEILGEGPSPSPISASSSITVNPATFDSGGAPLLFSTTNKSAYPSTVSVVNPDFTITEIASMIVAVNGVGYNPVDDYVYGYINSDTTNTGQAVNSIVRIGGDGTHVNLGNPTRVDSSDPEYTSLSIRPAGTITDEGVYIMGAQKDGKHYILEVTLGNNPGAGTLTYDAYEVTGIVPIDISFGKDGAFYGVHNSKVIRFDPQTYARTEINVNPTDGSTFPKATGGSWSDTEGRLFFYDNPRGTGIFRVDLDYSTEVPTSGTFARVGNSSNFQTFDATARRGLDGSDAPGYELAQHNLDATSVFLGSTAPGAAQSLGDQDEDGFRQNSNLAVEPGADFVIESTEITVTHFGVIDGTLHAWIDFDNNGTFDTEEYASATVAAESGATNSQTDLVFSVPADTQLGETYLRLRVTTDLNVNANTPGGSAIDGEVEDYQVTLSSASEGAQVSETISAFGEGAKFSTTLPWEGNYNQGPYLGVKDFTMTPGAQFGFLLVKNGLVEDLYANPSAGGDLTTFFSIPEANPLSGSHQLIDLDGLGTVFGFEDTNLNQASDQDYNDLVFQVTGAHGIAPQAPGNIADGVRLVDTPTGQILISYTEKQAGADNSTNGTYSSGVSTVGADGTVTIDFLYDGGGYLGEVGVFSLRGIGHLTPGTPEFKKEALRRALTNSKLGHVVIADRFEGAKHSDQLSFDGLFNRGEYLGVKELLMTPGDEVGFVLIPNSSLWHVYSKPDAGGRETPLFSMAEANPNVEMEQFVKMNDPYEQGMVFGFEDQRGDKWSDRDYNDIIFRVHGLDTSTAADYEENVVWWKELSDEEILNIFE